MEVFQFPAFQYFFRATIFAKFIIFYSATAHPYIYKKITSSLKIDLYKISNYLCIKLNLQDIITNK